MSTTIERLQEYIPALLSVIDKQKEKISSDANIITQLNAQLETERSKSATVHQQLIIAQSQLAQAMANDKADAEAIANLHTQSVEQQSLINSLNEKIKEQEAIVNNAIAQSNQHDAELVKLQQQEAVLSALASQIEEQSDVEGQLEELLDQAQDAIAEAETATVSDTESMSEQLEIDDSLTGADSLPA